MIRAAHSNTIGRALHFMWPGAAAAVLGFLTAVPPSLACVTVPLLLVLTISLTAHPMPLKRALVIAVVNSIGFTIGVKSAQWVIPVSEMPLRPHNAMFPVVLGMLCGSAVLAVYMADYVYGALSGERPFRRARLELCRSCGYNLRGNVSGVCPECGRVR